MGIECVVSGLRRVTRLYVRIKQCAVKTHALPNRIFNIVTSSARGVQFESLRVETRSPVRYTVLSSRVMHVLCEVIQGYIPAHCFLQGKLFCVSGTGFFTETWVALFFLKSLPARMSMYVDGVTYLPVAGPCVLEARHLLSVGQTHSRGEDTGQREDRPQCEILVAFSGYTES